MTPVHKGLVALGILLGLTLLSVTTCGGAPQAEQVEHDRRIAVDDGPEDAGPRGSQEAAAAAQRAHSSIAMRVTDAGGRPLVGARVSALNLKRVGSSPATGFTDADGLVELTGLRPGRYGLTVAAGGWLPPEATTIQLPAQDGQQFGVALQRGARIEGALYGLDGLPRRHGMLFFRDSAGKHRDRMVEPDERGAFHSGPLEPGVWEVRWVAERDGWADPRLTHLRAVASGERVVLRVTLDETGQERIPGHRVGISESRP